MGKRRHAPRAGRSLFRSGHCPGAAHHGKPAPRNRGRTILLFSHRLTTFSLTDRVLVLDRGKLLQQGSHAELLEEVGLYRDIFSAQRFMGEMPDDQARDTQGAP